MHKIKKEDGSFEIIMENGKPYSGNVRENNYNLPILENFKDDSSKLEEIYKNLNNLKEEVKSQISKLLMMRMIILLFIWKMVKKLKL